MTSTVVIANIEENNKKYLLLKKIASIFLLFISITMILLFLYFSTRNNYIFYIVLFFIFFIDIETSYSNYNNLNISSESNSNNISNLNEKDIPVIKEEKSTNDEDKNLTYKKLLKQIKKMKKEIRNSKIEIENLKKGKSVDDDNISFPISSDLSVVDDDTDSGIATENEIIQYKSTSDLEKLIDESMKQFENDLIIVVNDN